MGLYYWIRKKIGKADSNDEIVIARKLGVKIGERCVIRDNARKVFSSEPYLVTIGNHVEITSGVRFLTHEGSIWVFREEEEHRNEDCFAPIVVGNNVFIGMKSIIMPGIHIGSNVVIGAGSIVTKDVPDNTVVAGIPAKKICDLSQFKERLFQSEKKIIVPTKKMSREQKKTYLMKNFPEWFETAGD